MKSGMLTGKRRIVAVLASTAVIVAGLGLAFGTVEAASSVTPKAGPSGKIVHGTYQGKAQKLQTMLFQVDLNGEASFMFCIDIATYIQFGVTYDEQSWDTSKVPNLNKVARVLSQTNATVTKDPIEIAAAQAAIWHFSDGFQLDVANPQNDAAVTTRYNALVADAEANPVSNEPAGTLSVTPTTTSVAQGQPVFYDIATTATGALSIELSDAAVTAHPANGTTCDTATNISTVTGPSRICLTSTSARTNVKMTIRTASAPVSAGRVFIRPARQKLIIGKAGAAQSSETVSVSWTANGRPSVSVACPKDGVRYGQPTTFTATGTDPDGDTLAYQWVLNGQPIPGQTSPTATVTLNAGDLLSVSVTDTAGQVASADVNCPGRNAPTVTLTCPAKFVLGSENTFTAVGKDLDGDTLTYQWSLNGVALSGTNGPTLTTVINGGDVLEVSAADSTGLVSDAVTAPCIPPKENAKPSVTLTCPTDMVYGEPATYTAIGTDADGDPLTYEWKVNGTAVAGQTGSTATLTVNQGDKVSVTVNDGKATSDAAEASCAGNTKNQPPTVKMSCPSSVIYGDPTEFLAQGTDPDGNPLTYEWKVNGTVVAGQTGETATLTVKRGDKVSVTVNDGKLTSPAVEITCEGQEKNQPPTVTLECPADLVWGSATEFTATGNDPDGDKLTYEWKINDTKIPGATGPKITATLAKGDVISVTVTDTRKASSAAATGNCDGNSRPQVELSCPTSVLYGEPISFTAIGIDDDGDPLTYLWKINGTAVVGQTGTTATLTIQAGDRINVTAIDDSETASASTTIQCTGTSRPTVTITCPAKLVYGEPMIFIANGLDPDGDTKLAYSWYVNGTPVPKESSPKLTATVAKGDVLTVTVTDSEGAVSASAAADCAGNSRPTVALVCPEKLVYGQPTTFTATGTDADGDELTYEWKIGDDVVKGQTGATAELTVAKGDRVTVTATDSKGATSTAATSTCDGDSTPTVTTTCPARVVWGEPVVFEAVGKDDDGDTLTYAWTVNGTPVAGQTAARVTLTLAKGDVVTVTATDPTGLASAAATFDCTGKERPKISVTCPADFTFGQPTKLVATSTNAKVADLVFTWAVNGKVVDGTTSQITLTLRPDDVIGVSATDTDGLVAVTATTTCIGVTEPPRTPVPPTPSMPDVLGSTVYKAATQSSRPSSGSLPVTGGEAAAMALVALVALGSGLVLVRFSRRKGRRPEQS